MKLSFEPRIVGTTLGELFRNSETPTWNGLFERTPESRQASQAERVMAVRNDASTFAGAFGAMTEMQHEEFVTALTKDFFEHLVE